MKDELQLKTRDVEFLLYEVFNVDELVKMNDTLIMTVKHLQRY